MTTVKSTVLFFSDLATGGTSDKTYQIQLTKNGSGYNVQFQYGRRGGTLQPGVKAENVSFEEAEREYQRLVREKTNKGYVGAEAETTAQAPAILAKDASHSRYPAELLDEIDEEEAEVFIKDSRYGMQKKYDGERRPAEKLADGSVISYNKEGKAKPLPAEVAAEFAKLSDGPLYIDGELVGATYICFDLLELNGAVFTKYAYKLRLKSLRALTANTTMTVAETWLTTKEKQGQLALLKKKRAEGACFKLMDAPYAAGRNGQHKKFKFLKSATCKVVGMGHKGHNSATLALLKDGDWREVGRVSMNGKDSRIKIGSLVEIKFLYVGAGGRLYQPRVKELRTDIRESECTFDQLKKAYKEGITAA
jgi:bifunctional non-homologous end joining protein LigD